MLTRTKARELMRHEDAPLFIFIAILVAVAVAGIAFLAWVMSTYSQQIEQFKADCERVGGVAIIYNDRSDQCIDRNGIVMFTRSTE